ncbi:hypothetical protein A2837_01105 [Candidatus Kaiserbacteria bacterium RIFCSPHIGHO2_01_FULL_46_22]|uniref:RNA polymerase sigma factor n=1 Tax=Candidatus Kaiserbacteria bacterium RIFCSPHIGHO2_01_FULL_46_22 TaxID=1798475 RepID=A0A1F6BXV1_9BACT|nr:MAG: hypothetical protein A2837_01105 [Candidatus Kaiserbacteria bacterium RIFCSPHIGHO2_01_FULL_46_22]
MAAETASPSDNEVVKLALEERSSFGLIVERYQEKLSRYVTRLGIKDSDDRDDVLQEVFIKVYRNLNDYDEHYSFSAWIYRIAHNEAISWYRKKKVRPEGNLVVDSEEVLAFLNNNEEDAAVRLDQKINAAYLEDALAKLDPKYQAVLILRYFEHLEYEEISDVLELPTGTVGTLIHRAKKQLREALEKYE